jgi:periplasmic copper chaperone A
MKDEWQKKILKNRKWKVAFLLGILLLGACSTGNGIEAHEAWVRNANQGENTAIYLILHNHTNVADKLIRVSTDVASFVELHLTEVTNDVMRMSPLESIEILAGDEIEFKSGNYHIMLVDLKQDLKVGDEITVTFDFENYADVIINVPVQESAETMEQNHSHP